MGAQFDSFTIPACSKEELKNHFNQHIHDLNYDRGHDHYSGHMGRKNLTITSQSFTSTDNAFEWLSEHTNKFDNALAVMVGDFNKLFPQSTADKKLVTTYAELERDINNWDNNILKRVKAGKSVQRSCDKCHSKISVSFIKKNSCPVCNNDKFLQTDTDTKKFKELNVKFSEVSKKLQEAKKKYETKTKPAYWCVGALCSS